jgi:hypothetical protein
MHELKVHFPTKLSKAKLDARVISKRTPVPARADHSLFPVGRDYLCLLGGRNEDEAFADLWIYNEKS